MLYDEFLRIANVTENDVTYETYSDVIEPMYMATNLDKKEFVKLLNMKEIKSKYANTNLVKKLLVNLVNEMKSKLGHVCMHEEEKRFTELGEMFCMLNGLEYCYESATIYEFPLYSRGCSMYTGFVASIGNEYRLYKVEGKKLVCNVM